MSIVTAPPPPALKEVKRNVPPALGPNELKLVEIATGAYVAWVANDTMLDTLMTPSYWANHVRRLVKGASVRVYRQDMTLMVDLIAMRADVGMVVMWLDRVIREDNSAIAVASEQAATQRREPPEGYKVGHGNSGYYAITPHGDNLAKGRPGLTYDQAVDLADKHNEAANRPVPTAASRRKAS